MHFMTPNVLQVSLSNIQFNLHLLLHPVIFQLGLFLPQTPSVMEDDLDDMPSTSSLSRIPTFTRRTSMTADRISLAESMFGQEPPTLSDRLYKIKSRLSTAPDIGVLPNEGIVAVDQYGGLLRLYDSEGSLDRTLGTGGHTL